jgi:hypothetical protein
MPPKRKAVEDTRSPLEIAIAANEEQIRVCEQQVSQFRDGVQDLAVHTVKIKTLEQDVVPKEAELKAIMANFNKLLENSVVMSKLRGAADSDAAGRPTSCCRPGAENGSETRGWSGGCERRPSRADVKRGAGGESRSRAVPTTRP